MSHPETGSDPHPYSETTLAILKRLARHGGCMRIGALAHESALPCEALCATLNTLAERGWLRITWRRASHATLRDVLCVTLTRLGRARLPVPWVWHPARPSRRRRHPRARSFLIEALGFDHGT